MEQTEELMTSYKRVMFYILLLQYSCFTLAVTTTKIVPKNLLQVRPDHCSTSCGNVSIPFPFGVEEGCHLDKTFRIICNATGQNQIPIPFLAGSKTSQVSQNGNGNDSNVKVLDISLDGQLHASFPVSWSCYNRGRLMPDFGTYSIESSFLISSSWNTVTCVGCGTYLEISFDNDLRVNSRSGTCEPWENVANGSCSGFGCRQADIPEDSKGVNIMPYFLTANVELQDNDEERHVLAARLSCSFAFVAERGKYNFSTLDLVDLQNVREFPVSLDWRIGNNTCEGAKAIPETYACVADHSFCYDFHDAHRGYRCNCSEGFRGNPYVLNGCQDINECEDPSLNQCLLGEFCQNTIGNYSCFCPKGQHGDGRRDGLRCTNDKVPWDKGTKQIFGVSMGVGVVIVVTICATHQLIRRRRLKIHRERCFKENGGLLLQESLSSSVGLSTQRRFKIFAEKELNKATNNFDDGGIVGRGGNGVVYEGTLEDGRKVAIKRPTFADRTRIEQFINEVVVLSRVNHPNVVKLIGCCLETEAPLLVYEFISNNTLYYNLHHPDHVSSLPWKKRLAIAAETASALAYMHSDAQIQIIHRDIKSMNILLDDNFTAKVSDFGISRLLPEPTRFTVVQGTLGYMDPEYFDSGLLTDKSDVYCFGVVLAELLTGRTAIFHNGGREKDENLAGFFFSSVENGELLKILEDRIKNEGQEKQLTKIAELTKCCLNRLGRGRPTMKDIEKELQEIIAQ